MLVARALREQGTVSPVSEHRPRSTDLSSREQRARARLCYALDVASLDEARAHIARLAPAVGVFKVGLELFVRSGPAAVALVHDAGAQCFLDLKLHDIPNTVAGAVAAARALRVAYLTVHAAGGASMLQSARAAAGHGEGAPTLLAVTALTSLDDAAVRSIGVPEALDAWVTRLGDLAIGAGIPGLVCSPREVAALRARHPEATLVTPGVRPAGSAAGDQARAATPADAVRAGASLLVVGRPIRDASDPLDAARAIVREMSEVLA